MISDDKLHIILKHGIYKWESIRVFFKLLTKFSFKSTFDLRNLKIPQFSIQTNFQNSFLFINWKKSNVRKKLHFQALKWCNARRPKKSFRWLNFKVFFIFVFFSHFFNHFLFKMFPIFFFNFFGKFLNCVTFNEE